MKEQKKSLTLESVKKMSDEQLRIAVAELRGIFVCPSCYHEIDPEVCHCGSEIKKHNPYYDGHSPVPMGCTCGYNEAEKMKATEPSCPDYPHDLNAVHEARKNLSTDQWYDYVEFLCGKKWSESWSFDNVCSILNASARLHCEALVLCLSTAGERSPSVSGEQKLDDTIAKRGVNFG